MKHETFRDPKAEKSITPNFTSLKLSTGVYVQHLIISTYLRMNEMYKLRYSYGYQTHIFNYNTTNIYYQTNIKHCRKFWSYATIDNDNDTGAYCFYSLHLTFKEY